VVAWHLGAMHPYEKALTLILAFGPFVVLGIVIAIRRRMDRAEDEQVEGQARDK
jgi:Na+-translocating ferredoxin:NAD+ oxidoreductase RnfE subunit